MKREVEEEDREEEKVEGGGRGGRGPGVLVHILIHVHVEEARFVPGVHERTQSIKCYSRSKALRSFVDTRYMCAYICAVN